MTVAGLDRDAASVPRIATTPFGGTGDARRSATSLLAARCGAVSVATQKLVGGRKQDS